MLRFLGTKIGLSLTLATLIIAGATYLKYNQSKAQPRQDSVASVIVEDIVERSLERDDDGDGLLNWEEALYKTDPIKADSDNDGIPDGAEVEAGDSPLVSGTSTSASSETEYTPTDKLSQELFRQYLSLKSTGSDITPELSSRIAELVLSQDYSDEKPAYSASDIKTTSETSVTAIRKYGNDLGKILSAPPAGDITEIDIFQRLSSEPIENYKDDLTRIASRYEAMLKKLVLLPAPKEFAKAQADLANAITFFHAAVNGSLELETDPIDAIAEIGRYDYGIEILKSALKNMSSQFRGKGITFSANEAGALFSE